MQQHSLTLHTLVDILQHAMMVTFFVMVMMMLIEYITVITRKRRKKPFQQSGPIQVLTASILGIIPGCLGSFTTVSLYIHRLMGFGALLTTMIATTGDEAFVMFSMIPGGAIKLNLILLIISITAGLLVNAILRDQFIGIPASHRIPEHGEDNNCSFSLKQVVPQLQKITFTRVLLITGGIFFLFYILTGAEFDHGWEWEKVTFLVVTVVGLFIVTTVPDHFLNEHLWRHTIVKHIPRIFLWTLASFLVIDIALNYLDLENWIRGNHWMILTIALLVGLIPQSGPHIIFITLFAGGTIPFSVLLANSIVQEGHGALPLLAESGKSFFWIKVIKLAIGLLAGLSGILFHF